MTTDKMHTGHPTSIISSIFIWATAAGTFLWGMRHDALHAIVLVLITTTVGFAWQKVLKIMDARYEKNKTPKTRKK